jgi:hypothetical protein
VGAILAASALDLSIGAMWLATLVGLACLRRRRLAATGVLLASLAALGAMAWWGGARPAPASYATGWLDWLDVRRAAAPGAAGTLAERERARLRLSALAREELALTGPEIARRAGAAVALARRARALQDRAPRDVAAVQAAARALARTLDAAEYRDLEGRRGRLRDHLAEASARLAAAADGPAVAEVLRALEPAALARVSLRAVREDLDRVWAAAGDLVRALGGAPPAISASAAASYDESRGELRREVRYTVRVEPPVRLRRLDATPLREVAPPAAPTELEYSVDGEPARPVPPGPWTEAGAGAGRMTVTARWLEPVSATPIRPFLRAVAFRRLTVPPVDPGPDVMVGLEVPVDGGEGLEVELGVPLPPPPLERLTVPARALYFVGAPGTRAVQGSEETWTAAAGGAPRGVVAELAPPALLLRTTALAGVREALFRPNLATLAVVAAMAALTLILLRRAPRPAA